MGTFTPGSECVHDTQGVICSTTITPEAFRGFLSPIPRISARGPARQGTPKFFKVKILFLKILEVKMKKLITFSLLLTLILAGSLLAQDQTNNVFIPADQWSNSGISVSTGDRVCIWGFGLARFNPQLNRNLNYFGPGGMPSFNPAHPVGDAPTYCLIAKIGSAGTPIGIGTYWEFTAQSSGDLYFSVNDGYIYDNEGFFTAIVSVNGEIVAVDNNNPTPPPEQYNLNQNYPNPFNPSTTISYSVQTSGLVKLKIYNNLGQLIRTLVDEQMTPGEYTIVWDGVSDSGSAVAAGTYFYQLQVGEYTTAKTMIMLK